MAFPKAIFRHAIYASEPLPGGILPLNFSKSTLEAEWSLGMQDAKSALQNQTDVRQLLNRNYEMNRHFITAF